MPVRSAIDGTDVEFNKTVTQGGVPVMPFCGDTGSHDEPLHHWSEAPPFRLQSTMLAWEKMLPVAISTSRYSLADENVGFPTGSDPYWERVSAPTPEACTVVESLRTVQLPDEEQLFELTVPAGGGGALGATTKLEVAAGTKPVALAVRVYEPASSIEQSNDARPAVTVTLLPPAQLKAAPGVPLPEAMARATEVVESVLITLLEESSTEMPTAKLWPRTELEGTWVVTPSLDGICELQRTPGTKRADVGVPRPVAMSYPTPAG